MNDMFAEKPTYEQLEAENAQLRALVAQMTAKDMPVPQRRFAEFWQVYPNKKGRQAAEKKWQALQLDKMADQIITHVRWMMAKDDGWQRGYAPMGSTYVNEGRWTDVAQAAPVQQRSAPSKQMQAMMALGGFSGLDRRGNPAGSDAVDVPRPALGARPGYDARYANGMVRGGETQPGVGPGVGWPALPVGVFDNDG